ncbi:MAG: hypothetical protein HW376_1181 [candidate division NC10 bacterium]|jgi:hypothetical protein|nr:hypothetical protein [candidate division NC10 bacterium]
MGPVALLVFKTSEPANNGLVGSTPTRLRHPLSVSVHGNMSVLTMYLASFAVVSAQLSCVTF